VNNASTLGPSPLPGLAEYPLEELERVLRINTIAPLALTQQLLPHLQRAGGTIVNVTSDAGAEAYEGWGGYGSSKAALDQVSAVLAVEHPSLHIYAFDPGDMRTEMHQDAYPGEDISDRPEPETVVPSLLRLIVELPPSGRYRAGDLPALESSNS
jgi:NAD(P)-dependent dehydrogenase (short-subunit alcohol dehydrogenase family)